MTEWQQVRNSLNSFDRTSTLEALEAFLDREIGDRLEADRRLIVPKTRAYLTANLGEWYGAGGLLVGNESTSGWCWCHSFPNSFKGKTHQEQIIAVAESILEQVEQLHQFLVNLCALFDSLSLSSDLGKQEAEVKAAVEDIIDFVISETRCSESWYYFAEEAVRWFFEDKGIYSTESLLIEFAIEGWFSSWIEPSKQSKQQVAEMIAFEFFKQEFEKLYPSE